MVRLVDRKQGGITDELMAGYSNFQVKASECTECGVCMERCPFEVDIIAKMREAVEIFEAKTG
jgi:predicted aldo/keto reductase-like oxidoreductase